MPELSPETNGEKRERWKKSPPSLVVGVAYIECATPSPPMLQIGHECHNASPLPSLHYENDALTALLPASLRMPE